MSSFVTSVLPLPAHLPAGPLFSFRVITAPRLSRLLSRIRGQSDGRVKRGRILSRVSMNSSRKNVLVNASDDESVEQAISNMEEMQRARWIYLIDRYRWKTSQLQRVFPSYKHVLPRNVERNCNLFYNILILLLTFSNFCIRRFSFLFNLRFYTSSRENARDIKEIVINSLILVICDFS